MDEELNIPEHVRENIKKMLDEATKGIPFPEPLRHMQTQICFEMYKTGWRDAHRGVIKAVELMKDTFKQSLRRGIIVNINKKMTLSTLIN